MRYAKRWMVLGLSAGVLSGCSGAGARTEAGVQGVAAAGEAVGAAVAAAPGEVDAVPQEVDGMPFEASEQAVRQPEGPFTRVWTGTKDYAGYHLTGDGRTYAVALANRTAGTGVHAGRFGEPGVESWVAVSRTLDANISAERLTLEITDESWASATTVDRMLELAEDRNKYSWVESRADDGQRKAIEWKPREHGVSGWCPVGPSPTYGFQIEKVVGPWIYWYVLSSGPPPDRVPLPEEPGTVTFERCTLAPRPGKKLHVAVVEPGLDGQMPGDSGGYSIYRFVDGSGGLLALALVPGLAHENYAVGQEYWVMRSDLAGKTDRIAKLEIRHEQWGKGSGKADYESKRGATGWDAPAAIAQAPNWSSLSGSPGAGTVYGSDGEIDFAVRFGAGGTVSWYRGGSNSNPDLLLFSQQRGVSAELNLSTTARTMTYVSGAP